MARGLYPKARALLLATATPMQLNRVEAFDLLRFMPAAGLVRFSEELCDLYYDLRERLLEGARLQAYEEKWLRRYLCNVKTSAPEQWQFVLREVLDPLGRSDLETFLDHGFSPLSWDNLQSALTLFAPLGRAMLRHTRQLLREYQQDGHLNATLAVREDSLSSSSCKGPSASCTMRSRPIARSWPAISPPPWRATNNGPRSAFI